MSGEPKTLTLTLEEAMRAVHFERLPELRERHGYLADVQMEMTQSGWWVFLNNDGEENQIKEFDRWEDAASFALGVPVVARDEANEPKGSAWDQVTDEHVLGAFLDAQAEALRYREALEAVLNSCHRGIYDAGWVLEAVAQAEALVAPGLGEDYRKAQARAALERRLAGGEDEK